jgi:ribosomal protein S18 acetylase RimI-like enzyme
MTGADKETYIKIAENTGVFRPVEINCLREIIDDYERRPAVDYFLIDERIDGRICGFVILGTTPLTDFSWDIYWLVVDKECHRKGVGRRLLAKLETFVLEKGKKAVLRIETSSKKEYAAAHGFYERTGFAKVGMIPHFYTENDNLLIFCKEAVAGR